MPRRLAILCDYREEGWPSMDLVAEMLVSELTRGAGNGGAAKGGGGAGGLYGVQARAVRPPFKRRVSLLPVLGRQRVPLMFDRLVNRLRDYPRHVREIRDEFDLFHVADHSYASLVHALPSKRTGVFCHDLDAFAAYLKPESHPRPRWYRSLVGHVLRGMQRAAIVFHPTQTIRAQIERLGLVEPWRLVHAPLGVASEFTPEDDPSVAIDPRVTRAAAAGPFVLHVGNCALRKRMDVLLDVFAALRPRYRDLRLVKVSREWHEPLCRQVERLRLGDAFVRLQDLDRGSLAWLYRRAAAVLMPSEAEGFGLPTVEALACGAPVVASDIPVFREVGADAVTYCPVADVPRWAEAVGRILDDPAGGAPPRQLRIARGRQFSWPNHARIVAEAYRRLG